MIIFVPLYALLTYSTVSDAKGFQGFFVPEEIQTLLSVVYSRLPPTKIGSDKRFGVGFRLGRNADAQILVELGPQSETQPLANTSNSLTKRESRRQKYTPGIKTTGQKRLEKTADDKTTEQTNNTLDNTKTAEDKTTKQTNNTLDNTIEPKVQKRPEPFLNVFLKWLTRLSQSRQQNVTKDNT